MSYSEKAFREDYEADLAWQKISDGIQERADRAGRTWEEQSHLEHEDKQRRLAIVRKIMEKKPLEWTCSFTFEDYWLARQLLAIETWWETLSNKQKAECGPPKEALKKWRLDVWSEGRWLPWENTSPRVIKFTENPHFRRNLLKRGYKPERQWQRGCP